MADETTAPEGTPTDELTGQQKRDNVVRLAFGGDEAKLTEFVAIVRDAIPPKTGVVLRGSAVTGVRWKDQAPFDADGPGTSDLDLTLVGGDELIGLYKVTGFFVPGIHSRPLSEEDPEIAPDLVPLRERLMKMVGRPVNIQATRDFVMYLRGEVIGQPYLVLLDKDECSLESCMYNIRKGGGGRERELAGVIRACAPDLVVLQEATRPAVVEAVAAECGMAQWGARSGDSLGFMSREPVASFGWHKPRISRHAFLEIQLPRSEVRVFGVHLSAVHAAWTERRRTLEFRALLKSIAQHQHGLHLLAGDFNTLAPGELLDLRKLPGRLRALVWLSGGSVRWRTIQIILDGGYADTYRSTHPGVPGFTFPTWDPHARLDYVFVPLAHAPRVHSCEVMDVAGVRDASDHLPLLAVVEVP